jgi:ribosome-binding protein aMBF1 (putative translation factor)
MKLKDYLAKKRIRQIELAQKINAPVSVINVFINGWKPLPEKHLENLAETLGVTVEELKKREITEKNMEQ